ncbi:methyltransferase domain-containing protein [Georgenia sp. TF02-10]|uniref:class I SAM-dependent DNA methyltransferase n=1 Tax=Georgenia sp. TF02-10 TaxID=2917725 RepID=UPI001FA6CD69|nr:class I SAM-dependent methyltransferase [Georgenia sp. TF02-10]UNX54999.1 methyltransferase domain-containing protein [Georgenia sp. TF02-10]
MSSDSVRAGYDVVAEDYARLLPDLGFEAPLDRAVLDHFRAGLGPAPSVLDAGCGAGRLAAHLAGRGCRVRGVDLSVEMVRVARRAHPAIGFDVADLAALRHPDATFDGVVAWYSLIHTPPRALGPVVAELARVLAPGGLLLTAVHAGTGVRQLSSAYGHAVDLQVVLHDPDEVCAVLERAGLGVEVRLERAPRATERAAQAFVIARRPAQALRRPDLRSGWRAAPAPGRRYPAGPGECPGLQVSR